MNASLISQPGFRHAAFAFGMNFAPDVFGLVYGRRNVGPQAAEADDVHSEVIVIPYRS